MNCVYTHTEHRRLTYIIICVHCQYVATAMWQTVRVVGWAGKNVGSFAHHLVIPVEKFQCWTGIRGSSLYSNFWIGYICNYLENLWEIYSVLNKKYTCIQAIGKPLFMSSILTVQTKKVRFCTCCMYFLSVVMLMKCPCHGTYSKSWLLQYTACFV